MWLGATVVVQCICRTFLTLQKILLDDADLKLSQEKFYLNITIQGFPGGAVVENLPANAGDTGSSPGLGRSHMPRSN